MTTSGTGGTGRTTTAAKANAEANTNNRWRRWLAGGVMDL